MNDKVSAAFCAALLATSVAYAQTKKNAPAPIPETKAQSTVKEDYARAAYRALKMIESEEGRYGYSGAGIGSPKETNAAIDSIEFDARSDKEKEILVLLRKVLDSRLEDNLRLNIFTLEVESEMIEKQAWGNGSREVIAENVNQSPTVAKMHAVESACFAKIEDMLKAQDSVPLPECSRERMLIEFPKKADFSFLTRDSWQH